MTVQVGIDSAKLKLDVAILDGKGRITQLRFPNNATGHRALLEKARRIAKGQPLHFCMEVTALYHYALALFLVESGELVSVENPRRIKHFGIAQGATQKTDRADARVIAHYARVMVPPAWKLAEPHFRELVALDRRITELKVMQTQESNRLESPCLPVLVVQGVEASIAAFQTQILALEKRICELLKENEELSKQVELLQSIPGIAWRAAVGLLAEMGDLRNYASAQDLAAWLGLNPTHKRSGTSVNGKSKISKTGNAHARARLYMPTVVATKHNPIIKDFYTKLVANHKPKKSALIAAERKLVMICYGVLKSGKPFDKNYGKKESQTLTS